MEDAMAVRELALCCMLAGLAPSRTTQAVTGRVTFTPNQMTFQNEHH
jgi:hypothetical protein